ncbi:ribosome small subunit-dependent GTPase A [Georgenia sp. SUBG003]|uniref:ribosome small subunit-dependent GTPase A n=1 Tax=Georgenia sp. SUBG003 TaxID=1497974 RepID=UPI0004D69CBF|nr:ribosome-associated GTPase [Georgenia sp. SUBG003]
MAPSTAVDLLALGWDPALGVHLPSGTFPARVTRVDRGAAESLAGRGPVRARFAGRVRLAAGEDPVALPCVGDWVGLRPADEGYRLVVVLPRRTAFVRGGVERHARGGLSGDGQGQVLAANIDVVLVTEPSRHGDDPADLERIERLVALAWESGGEPVVLITKADLADDLGALLARVTASVPGVEVVAVSAVDGRGVDQVLDRLSGSRTAALVGPSGAGKSTLVNALAGEDVMSTQAVRAADGRGRHTTVHRQLVLLPGGGLVIDTPGLRRVGLYEIGDGVDRVFADVDELALGCRFVDCSHRTEPGCAVVAAVESGDLPRRRLESWRRLQREAAWMATRTDARLRAQQRSWGALHRELRRSGRSRP